MKKKHYLLSELADLLECKLYGDPNATIYDVNTLEDASKGEASFLANPKYREKMLGSKASVIFASEVDSSAKEQNFLVSENPSRSFQKLAQLLIFSSNDSGFSNIHPTSVIHPDATIGENVQIGPYVVIDRDVKIGKNSTIYSHTYIGVGTSIGENCCIYSNVTIREKCILKNRVIIQPGAVIGSCGFGYTFNDQGEAKKLEQIGFVLLEDDVEIGANTTIDRARFKSTIIKKGAKIDNLVQIAHNVEIGEHNIIAAQTGIAGSTKTGQYVMMGGQVGIVGHVTINSNTKIATRGGVNRSLTEGTYRGSPVFPIHEYNKQKVHVKRLASYVKRIEELEKKLEALENS